MSLLDTLSRSNRQVGADMTTQISRLKLDVKDMLEKFRKEMKVLKDTQSQGASSQSGPRVLPHPHGDQDYDHIVAMLDNYRERESDITISLILLDSICFEQMKFRHAKIPEVHPETFDWVFAAKFKSWAQSTDPIFWISGKPGSGKSTLMKHIVDNKQTPDLLAGWSDKKNLVIASYFFWINGTSLQRSQEGLLRALLFDAIHQSPSLIKHALPEAWKAVSDRLVSGIGWGAPPWTREGLLDAFQRISTVEDMETKLCVFVDGLDEYDGDHEDLLKTVRHLRKLGVKLCIASRPWNVFEDAFGSDIEKKIYMQELNTPDMERFVDDRLRSHPNFARLANREANEITTEIVEKSQGVFLWVHLVVRSLLEGLRNQDSLKLLQKRLRAFPSDLNEFFRHMFDSLDPIYRTHLAHMFQVALAASRPLSPIAYWFLDRIEDDPNMVLEGPVQSCTSQDVAEKIREVTVHVNGRSKGLLEVGISHALAPYNRDKALDFHFYDNCAVEASVDFLHRTVRDFLMIPEMQNILSAWQDQDFQPNLAICKIMLAEYKYSAFMPRSLDNAATLKPIVKEFLLSVGTYEKSMKQSPIVYVDSLGHACTKKSRSTDDLLLFWDCSSFLELAITYDLRLYVAAKLNKSTVSDARRTKLLMFMVQRASFWENAPGTSNPTRGSIEMMAIILRSTKRSLQDTSFAQRLGERLLPQNLEQFESNLEASVKLSVIDAKTGEKIRAAKLRKVHCNGGTSNFTPDDEFLEHSVSRPATPNKSIGLQLQIDQASKPVLISAQSSPSAPKAVPIRRTLRGSLKRMMRKLL
jgi:hypothetical protein